MCVCVACERQWKQAVIRRRSVSLRVVIAVNSAMGGQQEGGATMRLRVWRARKARKDTAYAVSALYLQETRTKHAVGSVYACDSGSTS